MVTSVEGAEDSRELAEADLAALALTPDDTVVGVSASGRTPYAIGAVEYARAHGALTVGLACNAGSALAAAAEHGIEVVVGPELLTGSTRLKAGTAQKLVLNMISTITMIRLGKTYGNLMVDVRASNEKLRARSRRIVTLATGADDEDVEAALAVTDGEVKNAILVLLAGVDGPTAARLLEESGGHLARRARLRERLSRTLGGCVPTTSSTAAAILPLVGRPREHHLRRPLHDPAASGPRRSVTGGRGGAAGGARGARGRRGRHPYQVVLGPGVVTTVTAAFERLLARPSAADELGARGAELRAAHKQRNATPLKSALRRLAAVFVPLIPALIGCGIIAGLNGLLLNPVGCPASRPRSPPIASGVHGADRRLRRLQHGEGVRRHTDPGRRGRGDHRLPGGREGDGLRLTLSPGQGGVLGALAAALLGDARGEVVPRAGSRRPWTCSSPPP